MNEINITVRTPDGETVIHTEKGAVLADVLSINGFTVPAACGRRGTCGKCAVTLQNGHFDGEEPDEKGRIRSCKAITETDAVIYTDFTKGDGLTEFETARKLTGRSGIAVDIGTTTVAAAILDKDGSMRTASCLNPQSAYGADVISRIDACAHGALPELTRLIRECVSELAEKLSGSAKAEELVITGNTTMLHLFCGVSPESIGIYPFTPAFTDAKFFSGKELGLNAEKITVLPSVSAFIGGDIVAGIYALGLHRTDKKILFADLGTNGELVFSDGGKLYCTSTAAGPALEGACIVCGCGGLSGAINSVTDNDGKISFTTINNAPPVGICGAGIVDAVAVMLKKELIDETGYLEDEKYYLSENIYLSQKDIRQYQLAKSAIRAGTDTLIEAVGTDVNSLDALLIAGGLGYYMSPESAAASGLLPPELTKVTKPVGNTSLQGACMCIGEPDAVREMQTIAKECSLIDLGGNPKFNQRFADNMFFEI